MLGHGIDKFNGGLYRIIELSEDFVVKTVK